MKGGKTLTYTLTVIVAKTESHKMHPAPERYPCVLARNRETKGRRNTGSSILRKERGPVFPKTFLKGDASMQMVVQSHRVQQNDVPGGGARISYQNGARTIPKKQGASCYGNWVKTTVLKRDAN